MDGEVPFHTVYIHALVRDEKGQKMSKSKGNVIDPIELIEKYGADALRFTLTAFAAQGRDVRLSEQRVEGYRNFCTKIWNAARFCEMNECRPDEAFDPSKVSGTVNKWIVGKVTEAERAVSAAIDAYKFNEAAQAIYQFTWGTFCDWYLELVKPVLQGEDGAVKDETRATAAWVLDQILHLMHPIMPFITEELWEQMGTERSAPMISAPWPELDDSLIDHEANAEMDWVVRLISLVRGLRSEMNVPVKAEIPLLVKDAGEVAKRCMEDHAEQITRMARLSSIEALTGEVPKGAVQAVLDEATVVLPVADVIDVAAEKARLEKEVAKQVSEIQRFEKKLANEKFVANAPDEVVETEREKLADAQQVHARLSEALERLGQVG